MTKRIEPVCEKAHQCPSVLCCAAEKISSAVFSFEAELWVSKVVSGASEVAEAEPPDPPIRSDSAEAASALTGAAGPAGMVETMMRFKVVAMKLCQI